MMLRLGRDLITGTLAFFYNDHSRDDGIESRPRLL